MIHTSRFKRPNYPILIHVFLLPAALATGCGRINSETVQLTTAVPRSSTGTTMAATAPGAPTSPGTPLVDNPRVQVAYLTFSFPGDPFTQLLGINNNNVMVGFHGQATSQGLVYNLAAGTITIEDYPGSAQTQVVGVNTAGSTAGFYIDTAGTTHGFLEIGGAFTTVDAAGTTFNQLLALNDSGEAAGYSSTDPAGQTLQRAYTRAAGGLISYLALPPNLNSQATGINNAGTAVGFYMLNATYTMGFIAQNGQVMSLEAPGATFTQALGINNSGVVVGAYSDSAGNTHGFEYQSGTFITLDVPGASATTLNGINDAGRFTGFYVDAAGHTDGFAGLNPTFAP